MTSRGARGAILGSLTAIGGATGCVSPCLPPVREVAPCEVTAERVSCPRQETSFATTWGGARAVSYQVPTTAPPASGWPVVVLFQGSFYPACHTFRASRSDAFGAYYQALTEAKLLGAGYAVVAPDTFAGGLLYWETNVTSAARDWDRSSDGELMTALLDAVARGALGPLDAGRLYATGISSGGYMTSRMAVSYPGRFKALAIQSGSYATCVGLLCWPPRTLPPGHPPTLFLHGGHDFLVPASTMERYRDALVRSHVPTRTVLDDRAGHEWLEASPGAIVDWFEQFP